MAQRVEIGAREVHIIGTKGGQLRTLAAVPGGKTATLGLRSLGLKWRNEVESIRLAGEFHLLLARLTSNHVLVRYVTEVVSRCSLILAMYGRPHSSD